MEGLGVRGGEVAGSDGVDLDAARGPLVGEGLGELGHAAFGGGVGGYADASLEAEEGGDVDDFASGVAGDDAAGGKLGELKDGGEVDLEDVLPGFELSGFGGVAVDSAGVVDEDVDAAEGIVDLLEEVFGPGGGGEVRAEGGGLRPDLLRCVEGGAAVAVAGDRGSGLSEGDGNGGTEAACRAGDQGDFAVEAEEIDGGESHGVSC